MKFRVFNINLDISRRNKKTIPSISKRDINELNNDYIDKIRTMGEDYYIQKSKSIILEKTKGQWSPSEAIKKLNNDGVFIIPNFLSPTNADELCKLIEEYSDIYSLKLSNKEFYQDKFALIQVNQKKIKGYSSLASHSKTVFDVRSGADEGMIDIFNIDKLLEGTKGENLINQIINNSFLTSLLKSLSKPLAINNINSYVNSGITNTRGFHVDAYKEQIKIFIYLTDVLDFDNGPYTYVKGSHLESKYRRINQYLSSEQKAKTETPVVPFDQVYPILSPKGSLIVSDQSGFHRGFPQSSNGNRRILTINCTLR